MYFWTDLIVYAFNCVLLCVLCVFMYHQSAQKYSEIIDSKLNSIISWYRLVFAALFNCEFTKRFPTQFIRSNGIDCTKYSRFSLVIKHIGRFFCVISSSRSFSDCKSSGNQISSHEQINGLSNEKEHFIFTFWNNKKNGTKRLSVYFKKNKKKQTKRIAYRQCRRLVRCQLLVPSLPRVFASICCFGCSTFPKSLNSRMMMPATPKC